MTDVTSFRDVPHIRILVVNRGCANSCESASRHVGFAADSELSHIPRIPVSRELAVPETQLPAFCQNWTAKLILQASNHSYFFSTCFRLARCRCTSHARKLLLGM